MSGYSSNREENYEIKYLRKVLTQVDNRIKVPESVSSEALLPMLDNVEAALPRDNSRKRPRWLSLQSGIAYAAAFALIVALFYSKEFYRPEIVSGTLQIDGEQSHQSSQSDEAKVGNPVLFAEDSGAVTADIEPAAAPVAEPDSSVSDGVAGDAVMLVEERPEPAAIGGGGKSSLLLEHDDKSYYCRANDTADPDTETPFTLEVVDRSSHELLSRINLPDINSVERAVAFGDFILLAGSGDNGVSIQVYDSSPTPSEQLGLMQAGIFVDARLYKDVVHIVSVASAPPEGIDAIELPNAAGQNSCIVTAVSLNTLEVSQKAFVGRGTVQLHNLNAYVHYEGINDEGESKGYIGQIVLNGMDIELGTVS